MTRINRVFFFEQTRETLFNGSLTSKQVEGMTAILDKWDAEHATSDDRWLAYMLGTTHHETDRKMWPIEEYGRGKGHKYGLPDPQTGKKYYGRGFVQLTWRSNYEAMTTALHVDFVRHPERVLDVRHATNIMFYGMINGSFTGKKLGQYFNKQTADWVNARRIINGRDRAQLVAAYARKYYAALSYTSGPV